MLRLAQRSGALSILLLVAIGCAGRPKVQDAPADADPVEDVEEETTKDEPTDDSPAPTTDGSLTEEQVLAFFDALGDLMVRDLLAWADREFTSQAQARAELRSIMDKTGDYSRSRMLNAAERIGVPAEAVADFLANRPADYVRLAEASTFGAKVRRTMDGPEVQAQLERVEQLP